MYRRFATFVVVSVLALSLVGCGGSNADGATPPPGSQGGVQGEAPGGQGGSEAPSEGQQLVETKCKMCHTLDRVRQANKSAEEWESTVTRMERNGLVVSDDEKALIIDYLATR